MKEAFIKTTLQVAEYRLKQGTLGSYYWHSGAQILPNRLSIGNNKEFSTVQRKGRNLQEVVRGQLVGTFKNSEESPLKRNKPYCCRTQIWQVPECPNLIGYGTIGITGGAGVIFDTGDLVALSTKDNWQTVKIYYFNGLGVADTKAGALAYANKLESLQL